MSSHFLLRNYGFACACTERIIDKVIFFFNKCNQHYFKKGLLPLFVRLTNGKQGTLGPAPHVTIYYVVVNYTVYTLLLSFERSVTMAILERKLKTFLFCGNC